VFRKTNPTDEQQAQWLFERHEVLTAVLLKILKAKVSWSCLTPGISCLMAWSHLRKLESCTEFHHSALQLMWWTFLPVWNGNLSVSVIIRQKMQDLRMTKCFSLHPFQRCIHQCSWSLTSAVKICNICLTASIFTLATISIPIVRHFEHLHHSLFDSKSLMGKCYLSAVM
jgi:hypothetical protein